MIAITLFSNISQNSIHSRHRKTAVRFYLEIIMRKLILLATVSLFALTAQNAFSAGHAKKEMMKKEEMAKDAMMKKEAMKKDAMMKKDHMMTSDYMVKSGDSLWTIAKEAYGSGAMYKKIKMANEGISDDLEVGQMIKLPK